MTTIIINILETATIALIGLLVKKYVFLEPDMESKKQRIFYAVSFVIIAGVFFLLGKDAASVAVIVLIGLNICLAREKRRLLGMLLMIPFLQKAEPGICLSVDPLFTGPSLCIGADG